MASHLIETGQVKDGIAIQTFDLTKKFNSRLAVDNLNLCIQTGELFALLGPNGAGKTTTTNMSVTRIWRARLPI